MKKNKKTLKQLIIYELVIAWVIAGLCSFVLGFFLDEVYRFQLDKANIYEDLKVDLKKYDDISEEFLISNNSSIGIVDDSLKLIDIKGIGIGVSKG